jgi:hypothetical protein
VVEDELVKLKWTREDETCKPWPLHELASAGAAGGAAGFSHASFSPLSEFTLAATMFAGLFTMERKCGPMAFPAHLLFR